ncbi:MAG: hypothetical protein HOK30_21985 [Rhodospirillaceae bacterium]|nr:hypothetical protein [Rhodospirillaceae bacterium]MBT5193977.1 hypothetical protein [Rhodospirillaceae bacterium]MBT6430353.1 hypothetical protein [Rhodospirillaceae bacterium]
MKPLLSLSTIYFMLDMFRLYPLKVRLWLGVLIAVHFIAPLFFLDHQAARWMAGAFICAGMALGLMHMYLGLTRILGLAHAPWLIPMIMIYRDLLTAEPTGNYAMWLMAAAAIGSLCLIIDAIDVVRYLGGDRTPISPPPALSR